MCVCVDADCAIVIFLRLHPRRVGRAEERDVREDRRARVVRDNDVEAVGRCCQRSRQEVDVRVGVTIVEIRAERENAFSLAENA